MIARRSGPAAGSAAPAAPDASRSPPGRAAQRHSPPRGHLVGRRLAHHQRAHDRHDQGKHHRPARCLAPPARTRRDARLARRRATAETDRRLVGNLRATIRQSRRNCSCTGPQEALEIASDLQFPNAPLHDVVPSRPQPSSPSRSSSSTYGVSLRDVPRAGDTRRVLTALRHGAGHPGVERHRHVDVPPRRLDAPDRQHAVALDLRRQRRGPAGPRPLRRLLSPVRHAAALAHVCVDPDSPVPTIGASGAIAGVMGAYSCSPARPRHHADPDLVFLRGRAPAFVFLGFWFLLQLLSGSDRGWPPRPERRRRHRLLGAHRRLRLNALPRQDDGAPGARGASSGFQFSLSAFDERAVSSSHQLHPLAGIPCLPRNNSILRLVP